jgi:hypothetical protein
MITLKNTMSYFTVIENNQIPINQDEQDLSMNNERASIKSKRDFSGSNNPHFGHIQSPQSRAAISTKQKQRYSMLRDIVKNRISEERIRQIVTETIDKYMKENKKPQNINL